LERKIEARAEKPKRPLIPVEKGKRPKPTGKPPVPTPPPPHPPPKK